MDTKIIITPDWLECLLHLEAKERQAALEFLRKLMESDANSSLHIEHLKAKDPTVRSGRVTKELRSILSEQPNKTFILLHLAHHDDAYDWVASRKILYDPTAGTLQYLDLEKEECSTVSETIRLFDAVSESKLCQLGLLPLEAMAAKSLRSQEELDQRKTYFRQPVYEILYFLGSGYSFEEVQEFSTAESMQNALQPNAPAPQESVDTYIIDDSSVDTDYQEKIISSIHAWRCYLSTQQQSYVVSDYNGPVKVLGEAGTGKTVIAMHRAVRLAKKLSACSSLLYLTFNKALQQDVAAQFDVLLQSDPITRKKIQVSHFDDWMFHFLHEHAASYRLEFSTEPRWDAAKQACPDLILPTGFFKEEWERVIVPQNITSFEAYKHANRQGRGYPLNRKSKEQVWRIVEAYQMNLDADHVWDRPLAIRQVILLLDSIPLQYPSIIVDEAQDFGVLEMTVIRKLAGAQHPNDLFITGDPRQSIYGRHLSLRKCGIDVSGRSFHLSINYRTTDEIRRWALSLLGTHPLNDLDDGTLETSTCLSWAHGKRPQFYIYDSLVQEMDAILTCVEDWRQTDQVESSAICIMTYTNALVDRIYKHLANQGISCFILREADERQHEKGICISTIHRIKGLEFDAVYLANVSNSMPACKMISAISDPIEKEERISQIQNTFYVAATRARRYLRVSCSGKPAFFLDNIPIENQSEP